MIDIRLIISKIDHDDDKKKLDSLLEDFKLLHFPKRRCNYLHLSRLGAARLTERELNHRIEDGSILAFSFERCHITRFGGYLDDCVYVSFVPVRPLREETKTFTHNAAADIDLDDDGRNNRVAWNADGGGSSRDVTVRIYRDYNNDIKRKKLCQNHHLHDYRYACKSFSSSGKERYRFCTDDRDALSDVYIESEKKK
jgi:hypothetical protein